MLSLPVDLTQRRAACALRELAAALVQENVRVLVDGAALEHFDSTSLSVLLALRRQALRLGKQFAVQALPSRLTDLARLYGVLALLVPSALSASAPKVSC